MSHVKAKREVGRIFGVASARSVARNVAWNIARHGHGRNAVRMLGGIGEAPASLAALSTADGSRFCKKALLFLQEESVL